MNRLKDLRESRKLSLGDLQKDLLKQFDLKIGRASLNNYERGEQNPRKGVWENLAEYFDVSVPYIMGLSDNRKDVSIDSLQVKISENIPENFHIENSNFKVIGNIEDEIKGSNNILSTYFIQFTDSNTNAYVYTVIYGIYITEKIEIEYLDKIRKAKLLCQFSIPDEQSVGKDVYRFNEVRKENSHIFLDKNYDRFVFSEFLEKSNLNKEDIYKKILDYTFQLDFSHIKRALSFNGNLTTNFRINSFNKEFLNININNN